jgi:hypothetical protein
VGLKRLPPERALIVPDEETWLCWGDGLKDSTIQAAEPGRVRVLVLPERVPDALVPAVRAIWAEMPGDRSARTYGASLSGVPAAAVVAGPSFADDAEEPSDARAGDEHGDGDDHDDDGDTMAITGEASADGLVMETLEVEAGPLCAALPGGLVVSATLDGDVVADCEVRQTLEQGGETDPPDAWSPVAWGVAELTALEAVAGATVRPEAAWLRLAGVEVERALNHLAWLHRFCRLLGWSRMTRCLRRLLATFVPAGDSVAPDIATPALSGAANDDVRTALLLAEAAARTMSDELSRSRLLAHRTAGLGRVSSGDAARSGLTGPAARASGLVLDARAEDPGYEALGFRPIVHEHGDAHARTLVRAREAVQSISLAVAAIASASDASRRQAKPVFCDRSGVVVEGARGPLRVHLGASERPQRTVPGADAARHAAAAGAVGREWGAALVTVASFDLSPWRVGQ